MANDRAYSFARDILNNRDNFPALMEQYGSDPDFQNALRILSSSYPDLFNEIYSQYISDQVVSGQMSGNDAYGSIAQYGGASTDQTSKFIDNLIGRENTANDQSFQTQMRDTSLLSTADQLDKLGLSSSNVIQIGGASSGVSSTPASQNMHSAIQSAASLRQQRKINDYNQKMALTRSLISAAGQMASSGIYGGALGAMKHSAAAVASTAAHSGLDALGSITGKFKKSDFPRMPSQKVGGFYSIFE